MAIHWQVKFKSLRANELYTVNIYDSNYSGQPVQLMGAAQPFVTEEDIDDDMFVPVRTQSGYIRIVNDNTINWRTIIPMTDTDRPVTLTDSGGNVKWAGFMQAQNFGYALYETPLERDFPIQCPLTVVSRQKIDITNTQIQNFAYLLLDTLEQIPAVNRPTQIVVQGGANAREWLKKRIDWQNFVDFDEDDNAIGKCDYGTILEDMCKFWGLTARTYGTTLYLTCADDSQETDALVLSYADLTSLSSGSNAGTVETMFTTATIGNIFASTNNNDYQNRGPNTAIVNADCNAYDESIYMSFADFIVKQMEQLGWQGYTSYGDVSVNYTYDKLSFVDHFMAADAVSGSGSFNLAMYSKSGQTADKKKVIRIKNSYNGSTFVSLESVYEHVFDGFLTLKGKIYQRGEEYQEDRGIYNKTMKMAVGIGSSRSNAQWFDGFVSWSSTKTVFEVLIGYSDGIMRPFSGVMTTELISTIASPKTGKLFIDLYGSDNLTEYDGQRLFDISDFDIVYKRTEYAGDFSPIERKKNLKYKAESHNNVFEEWTDDCIYATDNNNFFGFGTLINTDGTYMTTAPYGSSTDRPEQHLCDRVVNYWATSKRKIECELLAHDGLAATVANGINPRNKASIDGSTMYPISISRDWRDDVVRLILMEV